MPDEEREERSSTWINLAILAAVVAFCAIFWAKMEALIVLVITLGILVYVHELGHFLAAKWMGVRVTEFAFGFGPRLVTLARRGETDFTIRALPLGGFVNMPGMLPDEIHVEGGLASKPAAARALVFVAGPAMNLVLALVILCLTPFLIGTPNGKEVFVGKVLPDSPAKQMGMRVGDRILSIGGVTITSPTQLQDVIGKLPAVRTEVVVRRDGEIVHLLGTPRNEYDTTVKKWVRHFGIHQYPSVGPRLSFGSSVRDGLQDFVANFVVLGNLVRSGKITQNVGGVVAMYRQTEDTTKLPLFYHVDMTSSLSVSLAVFNLLPIPVLDGGHLFLLAIEVLRRKRLTKESVQIAQLIGLAVIGVLFVLIMYKDLTHF